MPCRLQQDHHECRTGHARQQTPVHPGHCRRCHSHRRPPRPLPASQSRDETASAKTPWYRRAYLWGQTNITEKDPVRYDIDWWRGYWKRTQVQAVIINAGGIVASYPSRFPLHHRAEFLGGRDLFGELTKAAHDDGIFVMARMDSNRTAEDFFEAHPDWFARDVNGQPYRAADKYVACINSPYYDEYLPDVLRRSSSARIPTDSPTTAGQGSAARASVTAPTARARFGPRRAGRCRNRRTGTMPRIANGSCGTTRGG